MSERDTPSKESDGESEYGKLVVDSPESHPKPGDVVYSTRPSGIGVAPEPIVGRGESSPLEEGEIEGVIPPSPLWAMKMRRHAQLHLFHTRSDERIRDVIGDGDTTIYVIDDGRNHVMLGRRVGSTDDGAEYCLIARAPLDRYFELKDGEVAVSDAFNGAHDLRVCCITDLEDVATANVFDVESYSSAEEIPDDYLPGRPYISFADDLEITAD